MEIITEGRNFRLVQEHELTDVMTVLEKYMPEALKFHQTIQTYLNDRIWKFYFYVSKNWPEEPVCLHFPGCTLNVSVACSYCDGDNAACVRCAGAQPPPSKNTVYSSFGVFCPSAHIACVDLLDTEDVLIDWREPMYLNFTHIAIMDRLEAFYARNYGVMERLDGDIYVCAALPDDLELECLPSDEVEMRSLTADNVQAIHDLYPASEIESVEVFERLVRTLPGYGVFTLQGELAAWMMHSYYGAMFSMQTKAEYRRKGYGIHLAQALTKKVIDRGYRPFVVIRPGNDASRNLYTKLGYAKAFETCRVTLNPVKLGLPDDRLLVLQPHLLRTTASESPTTAPDAEATKEASSNAIARVAAVAAAAAAAAAADAAVAVIPAVDVNGDEGIEDGRNEDTISLRGHERGRNNDDEDRDEGIDDGDDDITQNDDDDGGNGGGNIDGGGDANDGANDGGGNDGGDDGGGGCDD